MDSVPASQSDASTDHRAPAMAGDAAQSASAIEDAQTVIRNRSRKDPSSLTSESSPKGSSMGRRSTGSASSPGVRQTPATMTRQLQGEALNHFHLIEQIGGGGMGAVFLARDEQLGREVAVKVVPFADGDPELLRRFQNEAQSAAKLDHPQIARVFEVGNDGPWHYLVFEYVEGQNVREHVQSEGPLTIDEAVFFTSQLADALGHASRRGIVHRDIKPSNVILTPAGSIKLVDMGLARSESFDTSEDLTASGVTLGTFDYISPEQAHDPRAADLRSDLYSLGCTLFFMLTGSPPFPGGTMLQKLLNHGSATAPDIRKKREDASGDLAAILRKLLAKKPEERYQTAETLIADLQELAAREGLPRSRGAVAVVAQEISILRRRIKRHLPWVVAASLLLISVAWLELSAWQSRRDFDSLVLASRSPSAIASRPPRSTRSIESPSVNDRNLKTDASRSRPLDASPDLASEIIKPTRRDAAANNLSQSIDRPTVARAGLMDNAPRTNRTPESDPRAMVDRSELASEPDLRDDPSGLIAGSANPLAVRRAGDPPSLTFPLPSSPDIGEASRVRDTSQSSLPLPTPLPSELDRSAVENRDSGISSESVALSTPGTSGIMDLNDSTIEAMTPDATTPRLNNAATEGVANIPDPPDDAIVSSSSSIIGNGMLSPNRSAAQMSADRVGDTVAVVLPPKVIRVVDPIWINDPQSQESARADQVQLVGSLRDAFRQADLLDINQIDLAIGSISSGPITIERDDLLIQSTLTGGTIWQLIATDDVDMQPSDLITVGQHPVEFANIHFTHTVPSSETDGASLFVLHENRRVQLTDCTITMQNPSRRDATHAFAVRTDADSPSNQRVNSSMSGNDRDGDNRAMPLVSLELQNVIVRGEIGMLRMQPAAELQLKWDNGLLAISRRMIDTAGSMSRPRPTSGAIQLSLDRLTAIIPEGLLRMQLDSFTPFPVFIERRAEKSVFVVNRGFPHVELIGLGSSQTSTNWFSLTGSANAYETDSTLMDPLMVIRDLFGQTQTVRMSDLLDDDGPSWAEDRTPRWVVRWSKPSPSEIPSSQMLPSDFRQDGSLVAGFDEGELPRLPSTRRFDSVGSD